MEDFQKAAIRACRPTLVSDMEYKSVMDNLLAGGYLSEEDEAKVNAERTDFDSRRRLLTLLTKQNKEGVFGYVLTGLKNANQEYLAAMLEDEVQKSLRKLENNEDSGIRRKLTGFGVPSIPDVFILREEYLKKVRNAMVKLRSKSGWILIHGMGGSGKSMLAASSLHDSEVLENFKNIVWLPIGKVENDEKLMLKMRLLIQRLDSSSNELLSFRNIEEAQYRLRECLGDHLDPVLIVLDDVRKAEDLKCFNNCGGLFLVTSRNAMVLERVGGSKINIKIEGGFSFNQTEDVFCQMLDILVDDLPSQAKEIHDACEGCPIVIMMIASLLKLRRNRWAFYLKKLKERPDQIRQASEYAYDSLDGIIRVSIEDLDDSIREQYMLLAAFPKGTPLSLEMLSVLWDVDEVEDAEDIISELVSHSLAREEWDKDHKIQSFFLHDLHVTFLKHEDEDKKAHKSLLNAYQDRYKEWHLLPDDKYIMRYIGYHLNEAGRTEELVTLFTDLQFVGAKVMQTGVRDLIDDYERYAKCFEQHESDEKKKEEFTLFFERNMFALNALEQGQIVDFVQLGLFEPANSCVFEQALGLTGKRHKQHRWKLMNNEMAPSRGFRKHSIHWPFSLTALSLTPDGTRLLIGCCDNTVKLLSGESLNILASFKDEPPSSVCGVGFSGDFKHCIICTENSLIYHPLPPVQQRRGSLPIERFQDLSLHVSQPDYVREEGDEPLKKLENLALSESMLSCCVVHENTIFIGSHNGRVLQVNIEPFTFRSENLPHKEVVTTLSVSCDGHFVASGSSDKTMRVYDTEEMMFYTTIRFDSSVEDCIFTPTKDLSELQLVVATARAIRVWQIEDLDEKMNPFNSGVKGADFRVLALSSDANLLAAGMSNYVTKLWNFKTQEEVAELPAVSGVPTALAFTPNGARLLVADNKGVLVEWELRENVGILNTNRDGVAMAQQMAINWRSGEHGEGVLATQDAFSEHLVCVDLFRSKEIAIDRVTAQRLPFAISCVALSPDGARVAVGADSGQLEEWLRKERVPATPSRCVLQKTAKTAITCLRYVRQGQLLAVGLESGDIWLHRADAPCRVLKGHVETITALFDLDLDRPLLLSISHDGYARFWCLEDVETAGEEETAKFYFLCHSDRITCADVSKNQKWLVTGSVTQHATVRRTLPEASKLRQVEHDACVRSACFSPHVEDLVASGDDNGEVYVWRTSSNKPPLRMKPPLDQEQWVVDLAWVSENFLISVSGVLCLWSVSDGQLLHTFYPRSSTFSTVHTEVPGDRVVAVDSAGSLYVLKRV